MPFSVWFAPPLREKLKRRYQDPPLKQILLELHQKLAQEADRGSPAPIPYAPGTWRHEFVIPTLIGTFTVTPVYVLDPADNRVDVLDVGIWPPDDILKSPEPH